MTHFQHTFFGFGHSERERRLVFESSSSPGETPPPQLPYDVVTSDLPADVIGHSPEDQPISPDLAKDESPENIDELLVVQDQKELNALGAQILDFLQDDGTVTQEEFAQMAQSIRSRLEKMDAVQGMQVGEWNALLAQLPTTDSSLMKFAERNKLLKEGEFIDAVRTGGANASQREQALSGSPENVAVDVEGLRQSALQARTEMYADYGRATTLTRNARRSPHRDAMVKQAAGMRREATAKYKEARLAYEAATGRNFAHVVRETQYPNLAPAPDVPREQAKYIVIKDLDSGEILGTYDEWSTNFVGGPMTREQAMGIIMANRGQVEQAPGRRAEVFINGPQYIARSASSSGRSPGEDYNSYRSGGSTDWSARILKRFNSGGRDTAYWDHRDKVHQGLASMNWDASDARVPQPDIPQYQAPTYRTLSSRETTDKPIPGYTIVDREGHAPVSMYVGNDSVYSGNRVRVDDAEFDRIQEESDIALGISSQQELTRSLSSATAEVETPAPAPEQKAKPRSALEGMSFGVEGNTAYAVREIEGYSGDIRIKNAQGIVVIPFQRRPVGTEMNHIQTQLSRMGLRIEFQQPDFSPRGNWKARIYAMKPAAEWTIWKNNAQDREEPGTREVLSSGSKSFNIKENEPEYFPDAAPEPYDDTLV